MYKKEKFAEEIEKRFIENEKKRKDCFEEIGEELDEKIKSVFIKPMTNKIETLKVKILKT